MRVAGAFRCDRAIVLSLAMILTTPAVACSDSGSGSEQQAARDDSSTSPPACSNITATAEAQSSTTQLDLGGAPFGVAAARRGRVLFVAMNAADFASPGSIKVVDLDGLRVVATVPIPQSSTRGTFVLGGATITTDGRLLLVAMGSGVAVIDTARAVAGDARAMVGTMRSAAGAGTIHIAISPDDRYVAATEENAAAVTIYDLRRAAASGFATESAIATIRVNPAPVGVAFTPDGRSLLVTSQAAELPATPVPSPGTLTLIDVAAAVRGSPESIQRVVAAGCSPVRVAVAADGKSAWVTARGSNAVLAFDLSRLRGGRAKVLRGWARVGAAPVGVALSKDGRLAIVANSNRFSGPNSPSTISLVDTASVLEGRPRLVATLKAGGFPREVAVTPGGEAAAVTDFGTGQLTVINALPKIR